MLCIKDLCMHSRSVLVMHDVQGSPGSPDSLGLLETPASPEQQDLLASLEPPDSRETQVIYCPYIANSSSLKTQSLESFIAFLRITAAAAAVSSIVSCLTFRFHGSHWFHWSNWLHRIHWRHRLHRIHWCHGLHWSHRYITSPFPCCFAASDKMAICLSNQAF